MPKTQFPCHRISKSSQTTVCLLLDRSHYDFHGACCANIKHNGKQNIRQESKYQRMHNSYISHHQKRKKKKNEMLTKFQNQIIPLKQIMKCECKKKKRWSKWIFYFAFIKLKSNFKLLQISSILFTTRKEFIILSLFLLTSVSI